MFKAFGIGIGINIDIHIAALKAPLLILY